MSARRFLVCVGLPAALIAAAFLRAESRPVARHSGAPPTLEPGRPYALQLADSGGSFDLALDAGSQYELIVSSLGNAAETFHVTLDAHPRTDVETCPAFPVGPLARPTVPRSQAPLGNASVEAPLRECGGDSPVQPAAKLPGKVFRPSSDNGKQSFPIGVPKRSLGTRQGVGTARPTASERRFFLHVTAAPLEDPNGYVPITARAAAEGRHVRIYVDADLPTAGLSTGLVAETIRLLDDEIIPRSRELLGEHADVDGDGKLAVLITPWLAKLCGGRTSLNGCVRANDFQCGAEPPFGNAADVLYLNPQVEPGPSLKTLLAHEYTHAVCFSHRFVRESGPLPIEDDWLNEAIAHVAENLHGTGWSNLEERIARYLASPHNAPLVVRDYYRAGLWRDPGCRGATYLFLRFCVDRFDEPLLGELVGSPLTGPRNLEQATGISFPVLFRHWTIALADDEIASAPLCSALGNQQLSGAHRIVWRVDDAPCRIDLSGTATSFVRLAPTNPGPARITISNPPGARLQVTIIRRSLTPYAEGVIRRAPLMQFCVRPDKSTG